MALDEYLNAYRARSLTEKLDALYRYEPSSPNPALLRLQMGSLARQAW